MNCGLYIHIPWCIRKCPYCDFNSHQSPEKIPEARYITALVNDLKSDLQHFPAKPIQSIFIGGGTPSLFSGEAFENLFCALKELLPWSENIEITLEANPGTVEQHRFKAYRALGINRLSLGIQSFNPKHLQRLGRIHDEKQAYRAIESARQAGFDNLNIDLMHGLPGQSIDEGLTDLQTALAFEPEHLSWYQLTIEPNTQFYKEKPTLPADEEAYRLEQRGFNILAKANFQRYEVSAFSKTNREAQHNLNYWLFGDYYGIGAGAHGKLTTEAVFRTQKHRQPKDYLASEKAFLVKQWSINKYDLIFEFMLNTSRLERPIPNALFTERTQLNFSQLQPLLKEAETKGLIRCDADSWQVTPFGRRFTNDLQALFLCDNT